MSNLLDDGRVANPLLWHGRRIEYLDETIKQTSESDEADIIEALTFHRGTRGDKEMSKSHRRIPEENLKKTASL